VTDGAYRLPILPAPPSLDQHRQPLGGKSFSRRGILDQLGSPEVIVLQQSQVDAVWEIDGDTVQRALILSDAP